MTRDEILTQLKTGKISVEDAGKLLTANEPAKVAGVLTCKVSRKGAISVYGIQSRMPVTLYAEQWERLLDGAPATHFVLKFIKTWDGKEYKSESALEAGGKKVPYTATITRKVAA
ncbi:MAG: hypothetical protein NTW96_24685 [Planctomycetia bacterium]|nr:hypothetical protein [Planctomycetia bacterium]